jgi:rhodanese-related sulfurtransferase
MRKELVFLLCVVVGAFSGNALAADAAAKDAAATPASKFPGRDLYPEVGTYELDQLYKELNNVVVVDVRSQYEFETLRIKGASNISITDKSFPDKLRSLRASTDKPIIFYCNGVTCHKSYQAVRKALFLKIENTHAFDAGIFTWSKAHPDQAVLLGRSPINPADVIEKDKFNAHLLSPADFGAQIGDTTIVLDVRDRFQREAVGFFPGIERRVGLDQTEKLDRFIQRAKREDKTLLIYDEAGHQVQWLQYHLVDAGVKNYYFMKGGAKGYYEMLSGQDEKKK